MILGEQEYAKYPFLKETAVYVKEMGFNIEQLGTDKSFEHIVKIAEDRIDFALNGQVYKTELENTTIEVLSFLVAVLIIRMANIGSIANKFAMAESRRVEKFLEHDLRNMSGEEKNQLTLSILSELFAADIQKNGLEYQVPISSYLTHSTTFHEKEWKLINRTVYDGKVHLTLHEAVRLIRAKVGKLIKQRIDAMQQPKTLPLLVKPVEHLRDISKRFHFEPVLSKDYPPCITHAIDILEKGENLSHSGRLMLASYLTQRGQTPGQIAPLFKNAPDYNPRTTAYQISSLKGYKCAGCDKLDSQNLCHRSERCGNIKHPMWYK
jgi:DNA primase large subunit